MSGIYYITQHPPPTNQLCDEWISSTVVYIKVKVKLLL